MKILFGTLLVFMAIESRAGHLFDHGICQVERQALDRCLDNLPNPEIPTAANYYCVCEVQNYWANLNYYVVMSNGENRFLHTLEAFTAVGGCQAALRTNPKCK